MTEGLMNVYAECVVENIKAMDKKRLQRIIDRPFEPSPGNPIFDTEKFCAAVLLSCFKSTQSDVGHV